MARRLGVRVVPIGIVFGDGTEERDDTVAPERVHRALVRDMSVKSIAPSVLDYLSAIEDGSGEGDEVLVLTPATEFTVMYRTAQVAADLAERPVTVIDTRTAASAQGLVVLAAARAAADGMPPAAVVRQAERVARGVRLLAALDTLDALEQDGLVPSPSVQAARQGGARPLFQFRDGAVSAVGDAGDEGLVESLIAEWSGRGGRSGTHTTVFHAGAAAAARALRQRLALREPVARFSPAMTIHTGVGLVGLAWLDAGGQAPGRPAP